MKTQLPVWVISILCDGGYTVELFFSSKEKAEEVLKHAKLLALTAPSIKMNAPGNEYYSHDNSFARMDFITTNPFNLSFKFNSDKFYLLVFELAKRSKYKFEQLELEIY
jgi:hypothetical protein